MQHSADEMDIAEGTQYDAATKSIIGFNTIPLAKSNTLVKAKKALVFILSGTATRWKYVIGYQFTGGSINAIHFKQYLFDLTQKVESCGLEVNTFTSDMCGSNKSIWYFGLPK